ncbi:MAG: hypothetical protein ACKN9U_05400, partial [Pirellulaceae bacterium]
VGLTRRLQDAKDDKRQIDQQHTTLRSVLHSTCRFDWQRMLTAHKKNDWTPKQESQMGLGSPSLRASREVSCKKS